MNDSSVASTWFPSVREGFNEAGFCYGLNPNGGKPCSSGEVAFESFPEQATSKTRCRTVSGDDRASVGDGL